MSDPQQLREKIARKSRTVRVTGISPGNDAPDLFDYRVADALLPLVLEDLAEAWTEGVRIVYGDFYDADRYPVEDHILARNPYLPQPNEGGTDE